jgi:phosphatidylserine decarboxylase
MVALVILVIIVFIIISLSAFYKFVFLRDPKRRIPKGDNLISPADGKIINIIKIENLDKIKIRKGLLGKIKTSVSDICKKGYLINIMMDVTNVHVQRAPIKGKIISTKHIKGKLKNVVYGNRLENGIENEKNEIIIENKSIGKIKVIQIAGFLARRIECFVKKNQKINKGQRIGRIIIGSQVSLIFQDKIKPIIKIGDKVKAGETIIAKY